MCTYWVWEGSQRTTWGSWWGLWCEATQACPLPSQQWPFQAERGRVTPTLVCIQTSAIHQINIGSACSCCVLILVTCIQCEKAPRATSLRPWYLSKRHQATAYPVTSGVWWFWEVNCLRFVQLFPSASLLSLELLVLEKLLWWIKAVYRQTREFSIHVSWLNPSDGEWVGAFSRH